MTASADILRVSEVHEAVAGERDWLLNEAFLEELPRVLRAGRCVHVYGGALANLPRELVGAGEAEARSRRELGEDLGERGRGVHVERSAARVASTAAGETHNRGKHAYAILMHDGSDGTPAGPGMTDERALYSASEAARALGISLDTLRRWDRAGRIRTERDSANRRLVLASEVERLRGKPDDELSARNRFRGVVRSVEVDGFLARVEIDVTEPARVVAVITREAVEELGLKPGVGAAAIVKSTSVMVER